MNIGKIELKLYQNLNMHWFETKSTDLIVWIPPTPPYIFYPLSTPKNWEEWALGHPLKKLKMHTQLGWATKNTSRGHPKLSQEYTPCDFIAFYVTFRGVQKCILNCGELLMDTTCFVAGRDGAWRATHLFIHCSIAIWRYFSQLSINFCGLRPPLFVVAEGHNTWEVTETLFAAFGRHSSLWPKATTIEK